MVTDGVYGVLYSECVCGNFANLIIFLLQITFHLVYFVSLFIL